MKGQFGSKKEKKTDSRSRDLEYFQTNQSGKCPIYSVNNPALAGNVTTSCQGRLVVLLHAACRTHERCLCNHATQNSPGRCHWAGWGGVEIGGLRHCNLTVRASS